MRCATAALAAMAIGAVTSAGSVEGFWVGSTAVPGYPLLLQAHIRSDGAGLAGEIAGFAQVPLGFDAVELPRTPMRDLIFAEGRLSFTLEVDGRPMECRTTAKGDDVLAGHITAGSGRWPIRLMRAELHSSADDAALVGTYGTADVRCAITWREDGGLRWIDLGSGSALTLHALTDGRFVTGEAVLAGKPETDVVVFERGPACVTALTRKSASGTIALLREDSFSQTAVRFASGDAEIAGTLLLPRGEGRVPAVALVHGSGPIYRTALFERAVRFTEMGLAVLVYDKRGTGQSSGTWDLATYDDLAADAAAAVRWLEQHPRVDPARVGLQGHSEAGAIMPRAALDAAAAFLVVISAGPADMAEQFLFDKRNDLAGAGLDEEAQSRALDLLTRVYAHLRTGEVDREALEADFIEAQEHAWFSHTGLPRLPELPDRDSPDPRMVRWRRELTFETVDHVRQLHVPVLVLLGRCDRIVPAELNATAWRQAFAEHPDALSLHLLDAEHSMRAESTDGRKPLVPEYWQLQRAWLQLHVLGERR